MRTWLSWLWVYLRAIRERRIDRNWQGPSERGLF